MKPVAFSASFNPLQLLKSIRHHGQDSEGGNSSDGDSDEMPMMKTPSHTTSWALAPNMQETIAVAIRIRPWLSHELRESRGRAEALRVGADAHSVILSKDIVHRGTLHGDEKSYVYDHVFDSRAGAQGFATQEHVYNVLGKHLVKGAMAGYNGCLFAYGQTGAGKTHTIVGHGTTPEQRGLLPRVIGGLFAELEAHPCATVALKVSLMEIYNEAVYDLLVPPKNGICPGRAVSDRLHVHYTPKVGLVIEGLSEVMAATLVDAEELIDFGMKMRSIAATGMNSRSSRAHTIFTFRLEQSHANGDTKMSQVQVVDLAGREPERQSALKGEDVARTKERSAINTSLFHLSQCIANLSKNAAGKHLCFRNSKLTLVLMDSLGKNSRTSMVAAVSPRMEHADETISTLRFASNVKLVKTQASCNAVNKKGLVAELQQEIERLKSEHQGQCAELTSMLVGICEKYTESQAFSKLQADEVHNQQKQALQHMGLTSIELSKASSTRPHLLNLSEDPFIEGSLMYFLKSAADTTLGSAADNSIQLFGLGVASHHCSIRWDESEGLSLVIFDDASDDEVYMEYRAANRRQTAKEITQTGQDHEASKESQVRRGGSCSSITNALEEPQVLLNGERVLGTARLYHHDRLVIGQTCAFRVVHPGSTCNPDETGYTDSSDESDADPCQSMVVDVHVPTHFGMHVVNRYMHHLDAGQKAAFKQTAKEMAARVDEANWLANQMLQEEGLEFQLRVLMDTDLRALSSKVPDLCVAVLSSAVDSQNVACNEVVQTLRFVWPLPKFRERLCIMRQRWKDLQGLSSQGISRSSDSVFCADSWEQQDSAEEELLFGSGISATDQATSIPARGQFPTLLQSAERSEQKCATHVTFEQPPQSDVKGLKPHSEGLAAQLRAKEDTLSGLQEDVAHLIALNDMAVEGHKCLAAAARAVRLGASATSPEVQSYLDCTSVRHDGELLLSERRISTGVLLAKTTGSLPVKRNSARSRTWAYPVQNTASRHSIASELTRHRRNSHGSDSGFEV